MYCTNCGHSMSDNSGVCLKCGFNMYTTKNHCYHCGEIGSTRLNSSH